MRRVVGFGLSVFAALWAFTGPAAASDPTGDWACAYVTAIDTGVCQQNPLPEELPVPVPDEARVVPDEVPRVAPLVEGVIRVIPDVKPDVPDDPTTLAPRAPTVPPVPPVPTVPVGNPLPANPTSMLPRIPMPVPPVPYVPTGMPGTPI